MTWALALLLRTKFIAGVPVLDYGIAYVGKGSLNVLGREQEEEGTADIPRLAMAYPQEVVMQHCPISLVCIGMQMGAEAGGGTPGRPAVTEFESISLLSMGASGIDQASAQEGCR